MSGNRVRAWLADYGGWLLVFSPVWGGFATFVVMAQFEGWFR